MTGLQAAQSAKEQFKLLMGKEAETISQLRKMDEGWLITVEVVEHRRIPDANDMLASYEIELDGDGNMLSSQRTRRYKRDQVMDE